MEKFTHEVGRREDRQPMSIPHITTIQGIAKGFGVNAELTKDQCAYRLDLSGLSEEKVEKLVNRFRLMKLSVALSAIQ